MLGKLTPPAVSEVGAKVGARFSFSVTGAVRCRPRCLDDAWCRIEYRNLRSRSTLVCALLLISGGNEVPEPRRCSLGLGSLRRELQFTDASVCYGLALPSSSHLSTQPHASWAALACVYTLVTTGYRSDLRLGSGVGKTVGTRETQARHRKRDGNPSIASAPARSPAAEGTSLSAAGSGHHRCVYDSTTENISLTNRFNGVEALAVTSRLKSREPLNTSSSPLQPPTLYIDTYACLLQSELTVVLFNSTNKVRHVAERRPLGTSRFESRQPGLAENDEHSFE